MGLRKCRHRGCTAEIASAFLVPEGALKQALDAALAEADGKHYVEFEWVLDTSQLPRPLQIGVTGVGGGNDWAIGVERTMKVEAAVAPAVPP